jgi:hypothetical protein
LAPASWEIYSVSDVARELQSALDVVQDLHAWGETDVSWLGTWIPIMGIREDVVVVDAASGRVVRGDLSDPDSLGQTIAPDLTALITTWLEILDHDLGRFRWNAQGYWDGDRSAVPLSYWDRLS